MLRHAALCGLCMYGLLDLSAPVWSQQSTGAPLPSQVRAIWDMGQAYHQTTPTRERICINGLWQWQPGEPASQRVPLQEWGYFKVPGCWPGITDYMQKDSQTVHRHPAWQDVPLRNLSSAWYQREITVPAAWHGRKISVAAEYLNSYAAVYIDGNKAGDIRFPAGDVDVTSLCRPGRRHILSLLVVAMPLKGVMLSYTDSASAREVRGSVARRGLCGDVFLVSTPPAESLRNLKVDTSVRKWEITFDVSLQGIRAGRSYSLVSRLAEAGRTIREFRSDEFKAGDLEDGRYAFSEAWKPEKLWDTHTPQNTYDLGVSLLNEEGAVIDALPAVVVGFREFWIEGRDFYLNGSRQFLSAVPLDNAQVGAYAATYPAALESMERLKSFGVNLVYTHNYGCEPGSHLSFAEILRAADDLGMLVVLSMPHFSHYDWQAPDAEQKNGYARHADFYARVAQHHPAVVMYATSHNACGYSEDMNPHMIDGLHDKRDRWSANNMKKALRAESIIEQLDPGRIVYHHAGGNLGSMHTSNFYPNFVPVQELSDWFGHWATQGVKPVFMCEYGAPFTWDWAMYRGWYNGKREFGSAPVPWEFCLAEWNAQFFGDRAFQISEREKRNLRWEARQFKAGKVWHRWDYPHRLGSTDFSEREPVWDRYYTDNWRAFRTWGVSANSPWEHHVLFKLRPGMQRNRKEEFTVDWDHLQKPGFSPDYLEQRYERMDLAYKRSDWIPTAGAKALIRNNQPRLAYIAGKTGQFTSKEHLFVADEVIEKQIVVINNSRVNVKCDCSWSLSLPSPMDGRSKVIVETGQQIRIPMRFELPADIDPGEYTLKMNATFDTGETQQDAFLVQVLARTPWATASRNIAVFDPNGQTTAMLRGMGIPFDPVDETANLAAYDMLIVGKAALTVGGMAPDMSPVREGLKVVMFEQTSEVLEQRLGLRVVEYGLRQVFPRVPDHPVLAGIQAEHLRDWRGEATILAPRLSYELDPQFNGAPTVTWCGIPVPRAWRCGCRGNVASVLIEKPACGDFLPIVDGGFSLQYSPLLEYREGKGMMLFCQMDVTGRTQVDPAAESLTQNLLAYVSAWKPAPAREVVYIGEPAGMAHLQAAGLRPRTYRGGALAANHVLMIGPGSKELVTHKSDIDDFLQAGGHILAVALAQEDAGALPCEVSLRPTEYINAYFDPPEMNSRLAGVGPADVHCRDPRTIALVTEGAATVGGGVLAVSAQTRIVFCQLAPWHFATQDNVGLKRTFRRTSFLLARLLANLGVESKTPLLSRLSRPVEGNETGPWLQGFYLDEPEAWDDPYRFFRW